MRATFFEILYLGSEHVVTTINEKLLDQELEIAFKENPKFTQWFLGQTKFKDEGALYRWSRSDNPWGKVELTRINAITGDREVVVKESETDVLVVFDTRNKRRVALHIENKLLSGRFTLLQPEFYSARADKWKFNPNYESYEDWETVLVAPRQFFERFKAESMKFGKRIAHEDIAIHVPLFAAPA